MGTIGYNNGWTGLCVGALASVDRIHPLDIGRRIMFIQASQARGERTREQLERACSTLSDGNPADVSAAGLALMVEGETERGLSLLRDANGVAPRDLGVLCRRAQGFMMVDRGAEALELLLGVPETADPALACLTFVGFRAADDGRSRGRDSRSTRDGGGAAEVHDGAQLSRFGTGRCRHGGRGDGGASSRRRRVAGLVALSRAIESRVGRATIVVGLRSARDSRLTRRLSEKGAE